VLATGYIMPRHAPREAPVWTRAPPRPWGGASLKASKGRVAQTSTVPSRRFRTSGRVTGGLPSRRIPNLREGHMRRPQPRGATHWIWATRPQPETGIMASWPARVWHAFLHAGRLLGDKGEKRVRDWAARARKPLAVRSFRTRAAARFSPFRPPVEACVTKSVPKTSTAELGALAMRIIPVSG